MAVAELEWAVSHGLHGGLLLPGAPPGSGLPPLYDHDYYRPLWEACVANAVPVNCHSGGAGPRTGDKPEDDMFFLLEMKWWDKRVLRHLILGGILERFPDLQVVFTESGAGWIPQELRSIDGFFLSVGKSNDDPDITFRASHVLDQLSMLPSEYWKRQCHVGATFMHPTEAHQRELIGVDKIMWGNDYPHVEASFPYSKEAIRFAFNTVPDDELAKILGGNAAKIYGFSLAELQPTADRVGPEQSTIASALDVSMLPAEAAKCPAFAGAMAGSAKVHVGDNRRKAN